MEYNIDILLNLISGEYSFNEDIEVSMSQVVQDLGELGFDINEDDCELEINEDLDECNLELYFNDSTLYFNVNKQILNQEIVAEIPVGSDYKKYLMSELLDTEWYVNNILDML